MREIPTNQFATIATKVSSRHVLMDEISVDKEKAVEPSKHQFLLKDTSIAFHHNLNVNSSDKIQNNKQV